MEDDPSVADLEEKEDGELDSDQDENLSKVSASSNVHEDDIDKLLASCHAAAEDVEERISSNTLVSDRHNRKEKDSNIPSTSRNKCNDISEDRSPRAGQQTRSKNRHRSTSLNQKKSRNRKQKHRNNSRDKGNMPGVEGQLKCVAVDAVTVDDQSIVKNGIARAAEDDRAKFSISKEKELSEIEERGERLAEEMKKLEEKKSRLTKNERSVLLKKTYISDMCKRRDDYVARVKRLIQDINVHMKEEGEMIRDTEELRKEVNEEEVHLKMQANILANDKLMAMLRVNEEVEEISMIEVEEVVSGEREKEAVKEEVIVPEVDQGVIKSTSMDEHDEETLRNMLLMQLIQSKERSTEMDEGEERRTGDATPICPPTPIHESDGDEMEQEDIDDDVGEMLVERNEDTASTMCPWDLNGICKDDECPYMHNRSSSVLDYSQEISV